MTDKPAATGSGEPWLDRTVARVDEQYAEMPAWQKPTPPASQPTVTQAREKLEEAMNYSGDRWEEWGERALHVAELLDEALALLRAAEQK